jgi:hypothetical protein
MRRIIRFSFVIAMLGALVGTMVSIAPAPANASGSAPVHVVNTPLPVTGDLTATLSGPVTATVTGPLTTTLAGPIDVGNTALNPVLVRNVDSAPEHFQQRLQQSFPSAGAGIIDFDPVPAGKRLVVEYISVEFGAAIGSCSIMTIPSHDFGESCGLQLTFGQASGQLAPPWKAAGPTNFSVTPGNWVRVDANGQQPILSNPWSLAASISGYFVPYP